MKTDMCRIVLSIPNEVLYDTRMTDEQAIDFARKAVALRYYVSEGVSLGYCAEIAQMTKEAFIRFLSKNGMSVFQYDNQAEFLEDVANA